MVQGNGWFNQQAFGGGGEDSAVQEPFPWSGGCVGEEVREQKVGAERVSAGLRDGMGAGRLR